MDGTFSVSMDGLTRGAITECFATCTDLAGNESGMSSTMATEVCDPEDVYENSSYGDSLEDPIDEWGALSDDGSSTITITGNVLDEDEDDWYVISATDDVSEDLAAGLDMFHFDAKFVEGTGAYSFVVYRDDPESDADSCMPDPDGYTEYSWYNQDLGDGSHGIPSETRACGAVGSTLNTCEDNTAEFYIHVFRNADVATSCDPYELSVTNGVW